MSLSGVSGELAKAKGIVSKELIVGSKTMPTTFFVIDVKGRYNVLLRRDLIHKNSYVPSMLHQCMIRWVGDISSRSFAWCSGAILSVVS
jgi:tRNA uridine 5-carbamoylmethylation protein Kti12